MTNLLNTKVLLSGAMIVAAAAVVIGATFAFFSDTETSTGNVFAAGEIDLQIDSEAHYAGLVCTNGLWVEEAENESTRPDLIGLACEGTWEMKNLEAGDIFFALNDIKPGDSGENTISAHVFDNDAWARMVIDQVVSEDETCTEPESEDSVDPECNLLVPVPGAGELQASLLFSIWLDEGLINGFQCSDGDELTPDPGARCVADPNEGDNVWQDGAEPQLVSPGPLDPGGETLNIYEGLAAAWVANGGIDSPGVLQDGRMEGSFTYYFGLDWELPDTAGNEVQTDSLTADISFEVEQHRNNPIPFAP